MKALTSILLAAIALVLTTSLGMAAAGHTFKAMLSGKDEVPAVMTKATGEAIFKLSKDGKELTYTLKVKGIENATAAHIHAGKMGENGGVAVGLFKGPKEGMFSGVLAKGTIMDKDLVGPMAGKTIADLVAMIKSGDAYVNVHTEKNKPGEIRGQLK
jgi:CHRD domain